MAGHEAIATESFAGTDGGRQRMRSLRSRVLIFAVRNRHLLKGSLRPEVITEETDTNQLREQFEQGARRMGSVPPGIEVIPVQIGGMYAEWIRPAGASLANAVLYTHGGGYVSGNCADHRMHVAKLVQASGVAALLFDYRLAPEHPAPAAVEDTVAAYRWLLSQGVRPASVVIAGESAGGGLCLASLVAMRDRGLPLPCAAVASSPWLDLTCSADSYRRNARKDISLQGSWDVWSKYYVGTANVRDPWISPVYADLAGLPPVLIQVGTDEIMLDDAVRFTGLARDAGVDATLRVWKGMVHCFAFFSPMFPEATAGMNEMGAFIRARLGHPGRLP
jgi:epsilon-lactone hydrolase